MKFFKTEKELAKKLREDDFLPKEEFKNTSNDWLIDNAFQLGWVSNFENLLDGFLYFENEKESNKWFIDEGLL